MCLNDDLIAARTTKEEKTGKNDFLREAVLMSVFK